MKASIFIARFPFGNSEVPDVGDYLVDTVLRLKAMPQIEDIFHGRYDDTPITMTRNRAVRDAQNRGADFLLLIDSDMDCDAYTRHENVRDPNAKRFVEVAVPFLMEHSGPAVIAAPYCGPPPHENVYIFKPARYQSDHPNRDVRVEQYTREEAAQRAGIEECFALPTGLMLIDMRAFHGMPNPYFAYEWNDTDESEKGSTEDVFFSRNCALMGVKQYVAWDCWARHWKRKAVGRPDMLTMDSVRENFRGAIERGQRSNEKLIDICAGRQKPSTIIKDSSIHATSTVRRSEPIHTVLKPATAEECCAGQPTVLRAASGPLATLAAASTGMCVVPRRGRFERLVRWLSG